MTAKRKYTKRDRLAETLREIGQIAAANIDDEDRHTAMAGVASGAGDTKTLRTSMAVIAVLAESALAWEDDK